LVKKVLEKMENLFVGPVFSDEQRIVHPWPPEYAMAACPNREAYLEARWKNEFAPSRTQHRALSQTQKAVLDMATHPWPPEYAMKACPRQAEYLSSRWKHEFLLWGIEIEGQLKIEKPPLLEIE
jgi:hypothetical protein